MIALFTSQTGQGLYIPYAILVGQSALHVHLLKDMLQNHMMIAAAACKSWGRTTPAVTQELGRFVNWGRTTPAVTQELGRFVNWGRTTP
jgi:hypothetical protein